MSIFRNHMAQWMVAIFMLFGVPSLAQDKKIPVIATFSILSDLVKNIGGERVVITTLVGAGSDAHVYAPTPADAKSLSEAKLVFVNGLKFEGWMERLIQSSGTKAQIIIATKGIKPLENKEDKDDVKIKTRHDHSRESHSTDPHAWQNIINVKTYVTNIRDALIEADYAGKSTYDANAVIYLAKLDSLETEVRQALAKIPLAKRKVITSHDAFGYFGEAYGIEFIAPQGVSTDAEASAKDVARIIRQIRAQKIPAVFVENITDQRLMKRIAAETGAKIGGTLFSDALSDDKGAASTYIDMMRNNVTRLAAALN